MARRKKSSRSSRTDSETSNNEEPSAWDKLQPHLETAKAHLVTAFHTFRAKPWYYKLAAAILLLSLLMLFHDNSHSTYSDPRAHQSAWRHNFALRKSADSGLVTLLPGELPGYTGWARPAKTLARHFSLDPTLDLNKPAIAGEVFSFTIHCSPKVPECQEGGSLFYVRAYGPSVVTGKVQDKKNGAYRVELLFKDPGPYTVEVVLTFSHPPSFGQFPLPPNQPEPDYEGYLLPEFPLPLQVLPNPDIDFDTKGKSLPVCEMEDLFETDPDSAWQKARWVVTDKINSPEHTDDPRYKDVSWTGYQNNHNSLGIQMDYRYDDCRLVPVVSPKHPANPLNQCSRDHGPIHFVFIGDSNLRLLRNLFEIAFLGLDDEDQREKSRFNEHQLRASYFDLTGGALKCGMEGGDKNVTRHFQMLKAREDESIPERYVVLFNTGMHDIHRLCSHEFAQDRTTYLGEDATDATEGFHCVMHYRYAVEGLAQEVMNFPAQLRVFLSTTAGWPKYGNFGVTWPTEGGQNMPVSTEFVDFFNDIAYDVLKENFPTIPIMDGYWVSYARPDNREINRGPKAALEKKMSHPGVEVAMAMLRSWVTIVTQSDVCK